MCHAKIMKQADSNVLKCHYCDYEFCWHCDDPYTDSNHTAIINPWGCHKGFTLPLKNNFLKSFLISLKRIIFTILYFLFGPFILILATPICCSLFVLFGFGIMHQKYSCLITTVAAILAFCVGFIGNIIAIPLFILAIPYFIISQIRYGYLIRRKAL